MNLIILSGRVTKDAELSYIPGTGTAKMTYSIAVERNYQKGKDNKKVDFINCEAIGKHCEGLAQYITKGKAITVNGELNIENYQDKEGNNKSFTKVKVDRVEFQQGNAKGENQGQGSFQPIDSEDIPF